MGPEGTHEPHRVHRLRIFGERARPGQRLDGPLEGGAAGTASGGAASAHGVRTTWGQATLRPLF